MQMIKHWGFSILGIIVYYVCIFPILVLLLIVGLGLMIGCFIIAPIAGLINGTFKGDDK